MLRSASNYRLYTDTDIATGSSLDHGWRQQVLDMSIPELPDDPTPEQLAAWDELATCFERVWTLY